MTNTDNFFIKNLQKLHQKISTPALLIDEQKMHHNLDSMQKHANEYDVLLRPHCKTHKSTDLAKKQISFGAKGITVAKLSEAVKMAEEGIENIFIANQVTQPAKIKSLLNLNKKINLIIGIDDLQQISILEKEFSKSEKPLRVRIEIDCGFGRCGIKPDDMKLIELARFVLEKEWLSLEGLFTHAGHAYSAKSRAEITKIAEREGAEIIKAKSILAQNGIKIATVSVGSTPTAEKGITIPGITEARPGNYIFYDSIQQALGVCSYNQCSLYVLATVISQPSAGKIICDAGSKALNLDRGAHAAKTLKGFGTIVNLDGEIESVSEEHGIITLNKMAEIAIGTPLLIIPNHSCVVANLYDNYHVVTNDLSVQTLAISCRGLSQ